MYCSYATQGKSFGIILSEDLCITKEVAITVQCHCWSSEYIIITRVLILINVGITHFSTCRTVIVAQWHSYILVCAANAIF